MSDKAIEILIRLRDEASAAMGKLGTASQKASSNIKVTEKGLKDLAGAAGMGGAAEKIGKVGSAITELGPLGAVAAAGIATIGVELALLWGGVEVIGELAKMMDDAARQADILAPKLNLIAETPIVTAESLAAANAYEAQMGSLTTVTSGFSQVLVDAYAPDMERASAVTTGVALALLDVVNAIEKVGAKRGIIDDITNQLIGLAGATALGGGTFGAIWGAVAGKGVGAAAGSGVADSFAAQGIAAQLKLEAQQRSDAARKAAADAKVPKAKGGGSTGRKTGASAPFVGSSFVDIDMSDVAAGLVESASQSVRFAGLKAAESVEIDMSDVGEVLVAGVVDELHTAASAASQKGRRDANLGKATNAINTVNSVASGGVQGVASAIGTAGPVGAVIGAILSLADTIRNMGAEGLQNLIDSFETLPGSIGEIFPKILSDIIPKMISEGTPELIKGAISAIPLLVKAIGSLIPNLIMAFGKMFASLWESLVEAIKGALDFKREKDKTPSIGDGKFGSGYLDLFNIGRFKKGSDAYVDPSTGPRSGGGSTARTSAPDGGVPEQHVHVHIGTHVGTDAKSARELARMLRSHMGTRGTGLALE